MTQGGKTVVQPTDSDMDDGSSDEDDLYEEESDEEEETDGGKGGLTWQKDI